MKNFSLCILVIVLFLFSTKVLVAQATPTEFERPINFFLAAGVNTPTIGKLYDVSISPIDYSVQFDQVKSPTTKITTGLLWNPFNPQKTENKKDLFIEGSANTVKKKSDFVVALLVNVYQLSFSESDLSTDIPLDLGFGFGLRFSKFAMLATAEFTPYRVPRNYFFKEFYNDSGSGNKQLIIAGTSEPVTSIDTGNDSLFKNKVFLSFGFKIAYAFTNTKPKEDG